MKIYFMARYVVSRILLLCMAFLLPACQHAPLTPDHGYPSAWPKLTALTKGSAELGGTYANQGIATSSDGNFKQITLASLIPKYKPLIRNNIALPNGVVQEESVRLVVMPSKSAWEPYASLHAFIATGDSVKGYEIETASDENVMLYVLNSWSNTYGVAAANSMTRVFLTRAEDNSLIAQIHSDDFALVLLVPFYSAKYVWARFERIGD